MYVTLILNASLKLKHMQLFKKYNNNYPNYLQLPYLTQKNLKQIFLSCYLILFLYPCKFL